MKFSRFKDDSKTRTRALSDFFSYVFSFFQLRLFLLPCFFISVFCLFFVFYLLFFSCLLPPLLFSLFPFPSSPFPVSSFSPLLLRFGTNVLSHPSFTMTRQRSLSSRRYTQISCFSSLIHVVDLRLSEFKPYRYMDFFLDPKSVCLSGGVSLWRGFTALFFLSFGNTTYFRFRLSFLGPRSPIPSAP